MIMASLKKCHLNHLIIIAQEGHFGLNLFRPIESILYGRILMAQMPPNKHHERLMFFLYPPKLQCNFNPIYHLGFDHQHKVGYC